MSNEKIKGYVAECMKKVFYILAFLLPMLGMLGICKETGTYPFGEKSWLVCDMDNQYIAYFSYFKQAIEENGFFYTFSKTLGGDMFGFTAYYLMSPLNLLFLFVKTDGIHDMAAWIALIKIGLCGLSFFILVNYKNDKEEHSVFKKSTGNLIFSTAYGLMTYNVFYISNIMWFDAIYVLPLVILGIQRLVKEKKYLLYIVSLAYALITNFYIGYMLCIFSALYFVYFCIFECNEKWKERGRITLLFTMGSLLAGGLSMWCFLPAKTSLDGVKAGIDLQALTWDKNFGRSEFFVKLLPGSTEDLMAGLPNIYCGIIVVFFAVFFFLSSKINWKKKIGTIGLLGFMYCSFYIHGMNLIWHGFNAPIGFPYRNSFLFSFILILIAKEGFFACIDEKPVWRLLAAAGSAGAIVGLVFVLQRKSFAFLLEDTYKITFVAVGVCVLIAVLNQKVMTYVASCMGVLLLLYETGFNGADIFETQTSMILTYVTLATDQIEEAANLVEASDRGFYRMEKNFSRNKNDNMMYGISGLSHYSSTEKPDIKIFMQAVGFRNNGNWVRYNRGSTLAVESFLGVKYLLSRTALEEPYIYINKMDGTYIYQNPYAFSMAFLTDACMEDVQIGLDNTFEFQNALFGQTCYTDDIFVRETDYATTVHNLELLDGSTIYQKLDASQEAYIEYTFTVKEDKPIYVYLNTNDMRASTIQLNGVNAGNYFTIEQYDVLSVDDYLDLEVGDTLTVRVIPQTHAVIITDVMIYYEDLSMLEMGYEYQREGAVSLERISDAHLQGIFSNPDVRSKILFSIPYDEGWTAYIDGNKAETYRVAGIFLAIDGIEEGEHTIVLKYVPKNFYIGLMISLISFAIISLFLVLAYRKDKEKKLVKQLLVFSGVVLGVFVVYLLALLIITNRTVIKAVEPERLEKQPETIIFGQTEQDGNIANGAEPIEWIVLYETDGKALIVSKYALAYMPYSIDTPVALWETSYVRHWMNQEFYMSAFNEEERERIENTLVNNMEAGSQFVEGGNATQDYLFLLSRKDVRDYFGVNVETKTDCFYSQTAVCEPTQTALLQSAEQNIEYQTFTRELYDNVFKEYGYLESIVGTNGCSYWLRNPGRYAAVYTATVGGNGDVFDIGTLTTEYGYVRPAMWIEYP